MNLFNDHLNLSNNIYDNVKILKSVEINKQQELVNRNPTTKYYQTLALNLQEQVNYLTKTYNNQLINERREPGIITASAAAAERAAVRASQLAARTEAAISRVVNPGAAAAAAREAAATAAAAAAKLRAFVMDGARTTHPKALGEWINNLSPEGLAIYRELYGTTGVVMGNIPMMGPRLMRIRYIPGGNHAVEFWGNFGRWESMKGSPQNTPFGQIGNDGRLITRTRISSDTPIGDLETNVGASNRGPGVNSTGVGGGIGQQANTP